MTNSREWRLFRPRRVTISSRSREKGSNNQFDGVRIENPKKLNRQIPGFPSQDSIAPSFLCSARANATLAPAFAGVKEFRVHRVPRQMARACRLRSLLVGAANLNRVEKPRRSRAFLQCAIGYYEVAVRSTFLQYRQWLLRERSIRVKCRRLFSRLNGT
jgi:hypothetical protein